MTSAINPRRPHTELVVAGALAVAATPMVVAWLGLSHLVSVLRRTGRRRPPLRLVPATADGSA